MRSINRVFILTQERIPQASTFLCFIESIRGRRYTRRTIAYWFLQLVEKQDYILGDLREIIASLYVLSNSEDRGSKNRIHDCTKVGKNAILRAFWDDVCENGRKKKSRGA